MIPTIRETLLFISKILNDSQIPHVLIGGVALGYHAEPRATQDVDLTLAVDEKSWSAFRKALEKEKIIWILSQVPAGETTPDFARFSWRGRKVDLQISKTAYQDEVVRRSLKKKEEGQTIFVATPEDLFVLKLIANRGQDLTDLENLLRHNPELDFVYIRKWCRHWEIEGHLDAFLASLKIR